MRHIEPHAALSAFPWLADPLLVDSVLNRGIERARAGRLEDAFADLSEAAERDRGNSLALYNLGLWHLEHKNYDQAVATYTAAIGQLQQQNNRASSLLAESFHNRGNAHFERGEIDLALADYDQALRLKSPMAETLVNQGVAQTAKREFDAAISSFDRAIEINPTLDRAFVHRGTAFRHKGDFDRAFADYDRALELSADDPFALCVRGIAYNEKGEYRRAIGDFSAALAAAPRLVEAFNNRGVAYALLGERDNALRDFDEALRLQSALPTAYFNRANLYLQQEPDRAIRDFRKALELDPTYADAYLQLGLLHQRKGDDAQAISDLTAAIELKPTYAEAYEARGTSLARRDDLGAAISDFTEAIRHKPDLIIAIVNRAAAYGRRGETNRAIVELTRAIQIKPTDIAYYNRALSYNFLGDIEYAILDFTHAARLNPAMMTTLEKTFGLKSNIYVAVAAYNENFHKQYPPLAESIVNYRNELDKQIMFASHGDLAHGDVLRSNQLANVGLSMTDLSPEQIAQNALERTATRAPVNVAEIAASFGIKMYAVDFKTRQIASQLVRDQGLLKIYLADALPRPWKRFHLAMELYAALAAQARTPGDGSEALAVSDEAASAFARAVLLPPPDVRAYWNIMRDPAAMAAAFDVPPSVFAARMNELGILQDGIDDDQDAPGGRTADSSRVSPTRPGPMATNQSGGVVGQGKAGDPSSGVG